MHLGVIQSLFDVYRAKPLIAMFTSPRSLGISATSIRPKHVMDLLVWTMISRKVSHISAEVH